MTANERKLIEEFRKLSNDTDPAPIVVEEFGGAVIKVICPDLAAVRATVRARAR